MKLSQRFLVGIAALGLQVGFASAAEPAPETVKTLPSPQSVAAPAPSLVDACCPSSCDCPDTPCGGPIGGVGLYLIQPYYANNPAYIVNDRVTQTTRVRSSGHVNVSNHLEVAPMVWLGYMGGNGLGGRARYWYFREGTSDTLGPSTRFVTAHPAGLSLIVDQGRQLDVTTKLEVQALDLEGMQNLRTGNWDFLLAGGVRLARVSQTYNAFVSPANGPAFDLLSGHNFHGVGPVLAAESRRPLGTSGLGLYGSARGSLLFGSANQNSFIPVSQNQGADHRNRVLPVGELELGLEYGRTVGQSRLFGQIALVGQDWFGAGSSSRSTIQSTPGNDVTGGGYSTDSDLAFFGLSVRLGMNY